MIWLVGIAPSRPGDPALTPTGGKSSTADRLRLMLGMTVEEFCLSFPHRINVLSRARGTRLRPTLDGTVYVLGRDAWACLHLPRTAMWGRHHDQYATFILLPHPSGRNLTYNSPVARAQLRRILT